MVSYRKLTFAVWNFLLLTVCFAPAATAQDEGLPKEEKSSEIETVSAKQLETWITQLSEGNFRERRTASNNLLKAGKLAIPTLVKGAQKNDAELGARCVDILTKMYKGKDNTLKSAAEKALGELEKSSNISVAQRAQNATKKPEEFQQNPFGNIRFQINGKAVNLFQQANANANGNWSKTISENGKTTAIEKKNGAITIKVTEKVNGKNKTKKFEAKNETELKKKHPELYKLYQKQNRLHNAGNLAFQNLNLNGRNIIFAAPAGGNWQMQQQIVNGKRTTTVNENGKKIIIEDRNGKDIVVKVTETVKGKEQTKTYKAKDIKELKKKHSKIAKLYEKHTKQNNLNAVFGRLQRNFVLPMRIQRGGGNFFPAQRVQNKSNDKKIKRIEKEIDKSFKKLNEMAKEDKIDAQKFKSLNAEIQKLRHELNKLKK